MTKTIELRAQIPASRRIVVQVPDDMPIGDARVIVKAQGEAEKGLESTPIPNYSQVLSAPNAEDADLWGWEWDGPEGDLSPRLMDRDG